MRGLGRWTGRSLRAARLAVVALGVALALSLGACGDDDDETCGYAFSDVPTAVDCEDLADEFDCSNSAWSDATDICEIGDCLICGDFDTDFDGDLDTDGDIDADD